MNCGEEYLLFHIMSTSKTKTGISAAEFYANWEFKLNHDFKFGEEPATYFPGHPKQWGSEDIHIQPPFDDDPPEERLSINTLVRSPSMAVSHDGALLAVGVDRDIIIYDVPGATINQTIPCAHLGSAESMCFQPGNNNILVVSSVCMVGRGRVSHRSRIWDLEKERTRPRSFPDSIEAAAKKGSQAIISAMEWSDTPTVVGVLERRIKQILLEVQDKLDITDNRAYTSIPTRGFVAFSHDGSYMFVSSTGDSGHRTISVMDVQSGGIRFNLLGHTDNITWVGSSPDDTLIGTSSYDQTVRLWSAETGEHIRTFVGAQGQSWAGAFSPDGKLIAAGGSDCHVKVWDVESGDLVYTLGEYTRSIRSLAFSPDSQKLAAGASRGTLRVFDLAKGDCVQHWQTQNGSFVGVIQVLYTCHGLLVFKLADGRVLTYNDITNQKGLYEHGVETKGAHGHGPFSVSRDGARLFTSCFDRTIRIWRL
ncbi:hypothetical protein VNI00_017768 [Paramarasmius palmivorus]|uniref:Anaphase-promoting complex subunit 4-like WD40 domain-containing protein n=1 Tax=Paramarasmius palmivorus TaxID=297713 RepID=A0AAW0B5L4_9AGAR